MQDVVVDTNVLMHASDPRERLCPAARQFAEKILGTDVKICVDEGFDTDPAKNRSLIGHEYLTHIRFGSFAYGFILKLAGQRRISPLSRHVDPRAKKLILQRLRKPVDRIFVSVTINSLEAILVSHDFEDFSAEKRVEFRRELDVHIITAADALAHIP
jgi:hypothetical protein